MEQPIPEFEFQPFVIPEQLANMPEADLAAYITTVRSNKFMRLGVKAAIKLAAAKAKIANPESLTDWFLSDTIPATAIARAVRIQVEHPGDAGQYLRDDPLTRELFLKMIGEV